MHVKIHFKMKRVTNKLHRCRCLQFVTIINANTIIPIDAMSILNHHKPSSMPSADYQQKNADSHDLLIYNNVIYTAKSVTTNDDDDDV